MRFATLFTDSIGQKATSSLVSANFDAKISNKGANFDAGLPQKLHIIGHRHEGFCVKKALSTKVKLEQFWKENSNQNSWRDFDKRNVMLVGGWITFFGESNKCRQKSDEKIAGQATSGFMGKLQR